jgi:hypothetical protein
MGPDLIRGVQEITGREVVAFLSDNHVDPDIAIETFVLRSGNGDDQSRGHGRGPEAVLSES